MNQYIHNQLDTNTDYNKHQNTNNYKHNYNPENSFQVKSTSGSSKTNNINNNNSMMKSPQGNSTAPLNDLESLSLWDENRPPTTAPTAAAKDLPTTSDLEFDSLERIEEKVNGNNLDNTGEDNNNNNIDKSNTNSNDYEANRYGCNDSVSDLVIGLDHYQGTRVEMGTGVVESRGQNPHTGERNYMISKYPVSKYDTERDWDRGGNSSLVANNKLRIWRLKTMNKSSRSNSTRNDRNHPNSLPNDSNSNDDHSEVSCMDSHDGFENNGFDSNKSVSESMNDSYFDDAKLKRMNSLKSTKYSSNSMSKNKTYGNNVRHRYYNPVNVDDDVGRHSLLLVPVAISVRAMMSPGEEGDRGEVVWGGEEGDWGELSHTM